MRNPFVIFTHLLTFLGFRSCCEKTKKNFQLFEWFDMFYLFFIFSVFLGLQEEVEETYIMIKPDGVQRGLVSLISDLFCVIL